MLYNREQLRQIVRVFDDAELDEVLDKYLIVYINGIIKLLTNFLYKIYNEIFFIFCGYF